MRPRIKIGRRTLLHASVATALLAGPAITAVAMGAAPAMASTGWCANSDFESPSGLSGWTNPPQTGLHLSTTVAHNGSQSAYATVPIGNFNSEVLNDSPNCSGNITGSPDWIKLDVWVKGVAGGVVRVTNNSGLTTFPVTLTSSNWTEVSQVINTHLNGYGDFDVLYGDNVTGDSGTIYLDDAVETSGTDPASCPLMVSNCGFEDPYNLQNWNLGADQGTGNVSLGLSADAHSGSQSAILTRTAGTSGTVSLNDSPDWIGTGDLNFRYPSATTCTVSAWVKSSSTSGNVKLSLAQTGGSTVNFSGTPSTSWQQITSSPLTISNGVNSGGMDWKIYQTSVPTSGTLKVDDVSETCS